MPLAETVLLAIGALLAKHLIADFFLQTQYQLRNKGTYGHPGGLIHAGIHGLFTLPVFILLRPASLALGALIVAGEMVVHYHVDWLKERAGRMRGWTPAKSPFWWAIGIDQFLHGMTYLVMVWFLIHAA